MEWALVTGSAHRVGSVIATALAKEGYNIVVHTNKSLDAAKRVATKCKEYGVEAEIIQGDFSTEKGIFLFLGEYQNRFSQTKILVNNVGNYFRGSLLDTAVESWHQLMQTNLLTPFLLAKTLIPSLKKTKGSIINIGTCGLNALKGDTYSSAYTIAKTGLLSLTKSFALELAPFNVRVNMVSPGVIEDSIDVPKNLPMNRLAYYEEIAGAILFLIAPQNPYITGQNLEVAGGLRL